MCLGGGGVQLKHSGYVGSFQCNRSQLSGLGHSVDALKVKEGI